ncbi:hypothetical protein CCL14_09710 [Pseudomonas syringae]|nr:hypothetical protein [Pseudomonas syringae pv. dysoxyli]PBP41519.1 hypothetical protein CCL14_09710 [Pseudomonas syringae]PBP59808.1 hypothetical protein CCL18_10865 [Pseudomonas syringae]PBP79178.1 hypothetical protein CCL20_24970 [Pseudomonas syringae]
MLRKTSRLGANTDSDSTPSPLKTGPTQLPAGCFEHVACATTHPAKRPFPHRYSSRNDSTRCLIDA